MSEQFDNLQEARAEIARLRQENGDLGEKYGTALVHRAQLLQSVRDLENILSCKPCNKDERWLLDVARLAIAKVTEEAKP